MILSDKILIKISGYDIKNLKKKYGNLKIGDIVSIDVADLDKTSKRKVHVKCDVCGIEKFLTYRAYCKNINNGNFYACSQKCAFQKNKLTYFNKTGFEHQMYNIEVKDKIRKTNNNKYGVDHPLQNKEILEKSFNTCLKNNGVKCGFLSKNSKTNFIKKYGVDNPMKDENIKNKAQKTNIIKYGNKTSLLNTDVKKKSLETMIKNFGVKHALQNKKLFDKAMNSSLRYKIHEIGIIYQGKYEKDFLDLCQKIKIEVRRGEFINYEYNGENKIYFPDFYLPKYDLVVEIKSQWTWYNHIEKNVQKQTSSISQGFNYILILDKNYKEFLNLIS